MEGVFAPWHIIIIALLFMALFGAKRLPDSARALGQSLRIFKAETRGLREQERQVGTPEAMAKYAGQARFDPYTGAPLDESVVGYSAEDRKPSGGKYT